ncbi:MAG: formyltransferase family protein [Candidatus Eisenbacteria bacterium]
MRILIITQDSPFYLAENIDYLITHIPQHSLVCGCVVLGASPFGKNETIFQKMAHTYRTFGPEFFVRYAWKFMLSKLASGRRVASVLKKYGVPVIKIATNINSKSSIRLLGIHEPDLLISIQANVIFKKPLIELAPRGCLNLHTGLLPKYRGLMPTFWVMKNDEQETGVSVFFVDEGIDSGPILVQKRLAIENRTLDELIRHTKRVGMDAIIEAVELIHAGGYTLIENRDEDKTYYSFPTTEDVREFKRLGKKFF